MYYSPRLLKVSFIVISGLLLQCYSMGQTQVKQLPLPTGPSLVGVQVFQWINYAQKDTFTSYPFDYREVAVQIYYPAKKDLAYPSPKSRYAPLFAGADSILTNGFVLAEMDHHGQPFPVIFICPGRGVAKHEYSIFAEDLASHGYIVASIDMPYLGDVRYFDGRVLPPLAQFRVPPSYFSGPYQRVDSFFMQASSIGTSDVKFAIEGLKMLNANKRSIFYQTMDFNKMGIFGHSLGGRVAGQAAAEIPAIKAYISMEGIPPRDVRNNGLHKPMAFLMSESIVNNAIANYEEAIPNRKHDVHIIILKDFGHNSLTDYPITYPNSARYKVSAVSSVTTGRNILKTYFDIYLKNKKDNFHLLKTDPFIVLRSYIKS